MEKLIKILESKHNVKTEFGEENGFFYEQNLIEINKHQNVRSKYYTLLHESGHVILRSKENFNRDFPLYKSREYQKDKKHRMEQLREEFEAWRLAEDFAKENDLLYEPDIINAMRDKYIFQYVDWVINPHKYVH